MAKLAHKKLAQSASKTGSCDVEEEEEEQNIEREKEGERRERKGQK